MGYVRSSRSGLAHLAIVWSAIAIAALLIFWCAAYVWLDERAGVDVARGTFGVGPWVAFSCMCLVIVLGSSFRLAVFAYLLSAGIVAWLWCMAGRRERQGGSSRS